MMAAPLFSIVIPSYCRPQRLNRCLQAISQLDYSRDRFEVVVVDDGSDPPLEAVVAPWQAQIPIRLIHQANAGPAAARNTGAYQAKGTFLAFTDDDCTPAGDWLKQLEVCTNQFPDHLIGGRTLNALSENPYSSASQLLIDYLYEYYNVQSGNATFFASNNFAVPTRHFRELGGFDVAFPLAAGEDREFCDRWVYRGYKMHYAPNALVHHAHQLKLPSFWKQHSNYGRGAYHFHISRARRESEKIKVEPISFYWNLLTFPFFQKSPHSAIAIAGLLLIAQVANVVGFFREQYAAPA